MDKVKKNSKKTKINAKNNNKKKAKNSEINTGNSKKITKSKAEENAPLMMVPRLRLEPRLTPKPNNKNEQNQRKNMSKVNLELNESFENSFRDISLYNDSCIVNENNYEQESEVLNNNSDIGTNNNVKAPSEDAHSSKYDIMDEDDKDWENFTVRRRRKVTNSNNWNDKELMDLADGLQSEGFSNFSKVAEYIKTKKEQDVTHFIKRRRLEARAFRNSYRGRPINTWTTISKENLATWPNSRKWRKVAYNQLLSHIRHREYSEQVIPALCRKFYEEEKEPADPQVINVKLIYKYIMNCMSGDIPPQLPPKESSLVLDLLREVRSMPITYDFEEELKFVNGFKEATKFKPFHVKDEFKKRFKKSEDDTFCPNAVSVPEEVFMDLSRHKKIVQSFNPMITPVWMLQKEQEILEKHSEESTKVYID